MRAAMAAWRRALSRDEVRGRSRRLRAHLRAWAPLRGARAILAFRPLPREPQLLPLLAFLRRRGAALFLPRVGAHGIDVVEWTDPPDADGAGAPADPLRLELVLVPGLAFDACGGRLGRGGGHYDRLLPQLASGCLRVGVCFAGQLVPRVPCEAWDQRVDAVATEDGVLAPGDGRGWRAR